MKIFVKQRIDLMPNTVLAVTEYGNIVIENGIVYIPNSVCLYAYNCMSNNWYKYMHGAMHTTDLPLYFEYKNLSVVDNMFFSILKKNDTEKFDDVELLDYIKTYYRTRRAEICFPYINRGELWYDHLSLAQKNELNDWYEAWLDVTHTLKEPDRPTWLDDKLQKIEQEELL